MPSDRLERSRPKPAAFEAAASTDSAKRAGWYSGKQWCARRDLNPHGVTRRILSAVRLPVPPRAHGVTKYRFVKYCLEPSLGFEPSSAPYGGAASPQCFEGSHGRRIESCEPASVTRSSAETRALACERPTGRRGALCTRAPSWTFTSFDPCGSQFMPAARRTAQRAARAACRSAATGAMTLRSRSGGSVCW